MSFVSRADCSKVDLPNVEPEHNGLTQFGRVSWFKPLSFYLRKSLLSLELLPLAELFLRESSLGSGASGREGKKGKASKFPPPFPFLCSFLVHRWSLEGRGERIIGNFSLSPWFEITFVPARSATGQVLLLKVAGEVTESGCYQIYLVNSFRGNLLCIN